MREQSTKSRRQPCTKRFERCAQESSRQGIVAVPSGDPGDAGLDAARYRPGEGSAASVERLEQAFEETLSVHDFGVGGTLRHSLVTTNPIESSFDTVRRISRRVKRWRDSAMAMRWAGTGLGKAQSQFRRLKKCRQMSTLVTALEGKDLQATKDVA